MDNQPRILLPSSNYYTEEELQGIPKIIRMMDNSYINLPQVNNSIEIKYSAGYENNNFTTMPIEMKETLAKLVANNVDAKFGLCDGEYVHDINSTYFEYRRYDMTKSAYIT
jgi:hypothetical protein